MAPLNEARLPATERCDPCAVPTRQLATVVERFVSDWERLHPPATTDSQGRPNGHSSVRDKGGRFAGRDPNAPPSAVEVLAERTRRLDRVYGVGVPTDEIERVRELRDRLTELRVADALVAAARRPFAFYDGTLRVQPNPYAPPTTRGQCCPGPRSLTG